MYIHGSDPYAKQPVEPEGNLTWLDYLILTNPQGVMKVLASYGYTGYLAPQDPGEMMEACIDLLEKHGDQAVIDLLKSNPLYDIISDLCSEEQKVIIPFKNATGEESLITKTIKGINLVKLAENALIIIGAFYLAGKAWDYMTKSE